MVVVLVVGRMLVVVVVGLTLVVLVVGRMLVVVVVGLTLVVLVVGRMLVVVVLTILKGLLCPRKFELETELTFITQFSTAFPETVQE
jgi:hypothetical protein